jgi:putative transposase
MAGTFSQIYIQIVFAVEHRDSLISPEWEEELYKYITGIVQNKGQKILAINGMPDHIIKEKKFSKFKFNWQEGYGAFSYSHSAIDNVVKYVMNQKEHHKKQSFREEYLEFLNKFQIEYKDEYLFQWL